MTANINQLIIVINVLICTLLIPSYVQSASPKILFVSDRENSKDIWTMKSDGQEPKNLTKTRKTNEETPTASPGGIHMTFSSDGGANKARWIYIMPLDSKGKRRNVTEGAGETNPVWSPTGTEIAYTALAGNSLSIFILSVWNWEPKINVKAIEMVEPVNITGPPSTDTHPAWSPDGTKIAFSSNRDGDLEIHTMDVVLDDPDADNPPGLLQLTKNEVVDWQPSWSPDGTKIAFSSKRDGNWEIYVMDIDGQNQVNLTNNPASDQNPSWSPGGAKIAFSSNRDGNREIYVMDIDGQNQVNLTNNPAKDITPIWLSQVLPGQSVDSDGKSATSWGKIKSNK